MGDNLNNSYMEDTLTLFLGWRRECRSRQLGFIVHIDKKLPWRLALLCSALPSEPGVATHLKPSPGALLDWESSSS